jgi:hypothetical protein
MQKLLIFNTKYKKYGGEDANIKEEINFYKNFYEVYYLEIKNSSFSLNSILALFTLNNLKVNIMLKKSLNKFKPDFVYIHNTWFNSGLGIFRVLLKKNIVPIVKVHNFRFECGRYFLLKNHLKSKRVCEKCSKNRNSNLFFNKYFENSYLKSILLIFHSKKYFRILKESNIKIACLNNFQKNYLIDLGIDIAKLHILENPLPVPSSYQVYNPQSNFVIYAGAIEKNKGVFELCSAWKDKKIDGISLHIVGGGDQKEELQKNFESENIKFLGLLSNKDTLELIKKARAVITATKMYEVQPRLLNEASINSVPSIYPSFGGMDEYFPNGYDMSFKQYDYDSLKEKFDLLVNENKLIENSEKVNNFLSKKLSNESIIKKFKTISKI